MSVPLILFVTILIEIEAHRFVCVIASLFVSIKIEIETSLALSRDRVGLGAIGPAGCEIKWKSKNTMNVGELFYRFIYYYAVSFNFSDWIISVRTGKLFQRFGDDSLVRLKDSIRALEESEREREMMRRQAEKQKQQKEKSKDGSSKQKQENVHSRLGKRPRLNSGIYVKKDENSVVTITDSEDEESENNRTSIIKNDKNNSSDSEDHGLGVYLC